jgi:hypothetical protein
LNHFGNVNLGIDDPADFTPVVSLQRLKDVVVHIHSDRAEIFSVPAFHDKIIDVPQGDKSTSRRSQPGESGRLRSAATKVAGHKMEAIYRRYAIAKEKLWLEAADKLDQFHSADQGLTKLWQSAELPTAGIKKGWMWPGTESN